MQKKINALQEYEETATKQMQVVYLHDNGFSIEEIAKYTKYTVSTIKKYISKFKDLLDKAKNTFYHITQKVKSITQAGKQLVYLFKFYGVNDELICSKVGTTIRLPETRLKEEINYYKKHDIPVERAEICSVIDCGDLPAEGAESYTRAYYIKKYPSRFKKNDRFFKVDIKTRTFNKLVNEYLCGDPA